MKLFMLLALTLSVLTACNFKDGVKETGDAIQEGTQNIIEGLKEVPAAVSKASNKVEDDIRN